MSRIRVYRLPDDHFAASCARFSKGHGALAAAYPHVFFAGYLTRAAFLEQLVWIRANCTGSLVHNYQRPRDPGMRRPFWYTAVAFSDETDAFLYKMRWSHGRTSGINHG